MAVAYRHDIHDRALMRDRARKSQSTAAFVGRDRDPERRALRAVGPKVHDVRRCLGHIQS